VGSPRRHRHEGRTERLATAVGGLPGQLWHTGVVRGFTAARHHLASPDTPRDDKVAIIGFSQGAAVVERCLRDREDLATQRVKYVGLFGNPYRAPNDQVGPNPGGSGVIGPLAPASLRPIAGRWENYALPGDLIAACPADSLIRLVYPFTRWMSVQAPEKWVRDLLPKLSVVWLLRNIPELRDIRQLPGLLSRIQRATELAYHYQTTGIHGKYASRALGGGYGIPTQLALTALEEI
jgi:hypothetical protein